MAHPDGPEAILAEWSLLTARLIVAVKEGKTDEAARLIRDDGANHGVDEGSHTATYYASEMNAHPMAHWARGIRLQHDDGAARILWLKRERLMNRA
jgi:hypothetical protein